MASRIHFSFRLHAIFLLTAIHEISLVIVPSFIHDIRTTTHPV